LFLFFFKGKKKKTKEMTHPPSWANGGVKYFIGP
jgi:hypothetical protein